MPNEYIDANIPKTVSLTTGVGISQDIATPRTLTSSLQSANRSVRLPPPTLQILSNILHNTVSAAIAVLDASRPRCLRLARSLSSRAIFVGVLLILTSLFTIDGVAQGTYNAYRTYSNSLEDGQVRLSWTAPSNLGGATAYLYRFTYPE